MMLKYLMMFGFIATATKTGIMKAFKFEEPTKYEKVFLKFHKGNPGEEGLNNACTEATRKQVTWEGTSSLSNSAAVTWTAVSTTETYEYVSMWTAVTGGTFLGYEKLTALRNVIAGDEVQFVKGGLIWSVV